MSYKNGCKPKGYWTYDRCKEVALKYNTKSDLSKNYSGAYVTIYKNKWFELFEHMKVLKNMKWDYKSCKEEALKYKHRIDLKNKSNTVYRKILKNGWMELLEHMEYVLKYECDYTYKECFKISKLYQFLSEFKNNKPVVYNKIYKENWLELLGHMKNGKTRPKGYWTYNRCKEEALKYNNNYDFKKYSSSAYNRINKMGWVELKNHIELKGNKYNRMIYVYEFTDNRFYVGLTYDIKKRKISHSSNSNSSVYKHIKTTNLLPKLIIKSDYINFKDAVIMEEKILNQYLNNGWVALNKTKTGGLGGNQKIWNDENVLIESFKYDTYKDFYTNSSGAHGYMKRHNLNYEHLVKNYLPNGYWNDKEKCREESKKYKNRSEFCKRNYTAYNYSRKNNWLDEFYLPKVNNK